MKKILTVCSILLMITCLVFAVEKKVVAPPMHTTGNHEAIQNQPVAPTEYDLAKQNYQRMLEGSILSTEEVTLVEKYFSGPEVEKAAINATGRSADSPREIHGSLDDCTTPFPETFEGITPPTVPGCWVVINVNGGTTWSTNGSGGHTAAKCLRYTYSSTLPGDDWAISPGVALTGGTAYILKFWQKVQSATYTEQYEVKYGTGQTVADMTLTIAPTAGYTNTTYIQRVYTITPPSDGTYYIGWHCNSIANRYYLFLDDIEFAPVPLTADLGVSNSVPCGILAPNPAQSVSFRVTNSGGGTSPASVGYFSFDGGVTTGTADIPPIAPSSFFDVFFSTTVNLTVGAHSLSTWFLPHDAPATNDSSYCTITAQRPCASMEPADVNLDPIPTVAWAGLLNGNCGNAGKWDGSFTAVAGATYHFDLCPDAPGAGSASFDIDIKICDATGTILAGQDGTCTATSFHPNDFQWVAPANALYYVVLAPYSSYAQHNCTGTSTSIFTLNYYVYVPSPCNITCDPGDIVEVTENPADPNFATNDPDGGCNSVPPMFGQIACGQTVCGTAFTYVDALGTPRKDTDWYIFTIAQDETISVHGYAAFPLLIGIANIVGCPGTFAASASTVNLCETVTATAYCLPAGTYAMYVAPTVTAGFPAPTPYRAWLTCGGICPPCPYLNLDNEQVNNACGADAPLISCNASYCGYRASGDFDYYKLVLTERDSVKINVFANATPSQWPFGKGLDSYVQLYDANCTLLTYDDDFHGETALYGNPATDPWGYDSGLRFPALNGAPGLPNCLEAGTYYIAVSGFNTSSGPYVLNVQCAPCYSGCVPDQIVTLQPNPQSWDSTSQNVHACAHLVAGVVTQIVVPVLYANNVPAVHVTSGCQDCGDPNCWPLSAWNLGPFVYDPSVPAYIATITAAAGAPGCCVCIHLDYVLPVELRAFEGLAGDNSVSLTWSTASETHTGHFVIERDGLPVANVPATNSATGSTYKWTDVSAMNGTTYHYTLSSVSLTGDRSVLGNVSVTPSFSAAEVTEYALHQNFPNPFNPTTSIAVDLVENGTVSLKVYNLMGQEVASLINGNMAKGRHVVNFDARSLSSGLYLYRLSVNGFVAEKKMLLMK